jgi:hypothetical protein
VSTGEPESGKYDEEDDDEEKDDDDNKEEEEEEEEENDDEDDELLKYADVEAEVCLDDAFGREPLLAASLAP